MPTKRTRKARSRIAKIAPDMLLWFKDEGEPPVERFFLIDTQLRALWNGQRDAILAKWIDASPSTRPSFWWKYDAPEPLRRGESELAYLQRHKLVTKQK